MDSKDLESEGNIIISSLHTILLETQSTQTRTLGKLGNSGHVVR